MKSKWKLKNPEMFSLKRLVIERYAHNIYFATYTDLHNETDHYVASSLAAIKAKSRKAFAWKGEPRFIWEQTN